MNSETQYSNGGRDEVVEKLEALIGMVLNLENRIPQKTDEGTVKAEADMGTRIKERVTVNGRTRWIDGYSRQEVLDNYVKLLVREGVVEMVEETDCTPMYGDYHKDFYETFKQRQETNTVINRERITKNHILPRFRDRRIDQISTTELQKWFNELGKKYSVETILKIKNIMNPVFEAAVEDEIITRNPLASKRLEITGKNTVHHKALQKEKMIEIRQGLAELPEKERWMGGLLSYTGLRWEEVLGLRWEDVTDGWIFVRRAVVHPKRNMPEVKAPKTKTSERKVPATEELMRLLGNKYRKGFILSTDKDPKRETPMSYTEARRIFDKIRKRFGIEEYTAHDFRDTCATEWRESGMGLDVVARLLGHSKTETTEKRYVKYREDGVLDQARGMM